MSSKQTSALRIVLLGKTGVGKTSAMNTLMGKDEPPSLSASSQTHECKMETGQFGDQTLAVIDTPGLFDTEKTKEEVVKEIIRCTTFATPGPHVFLYVLRPKLFTKEDIKTFEDMETIFGKDYSKYTLALINCKTEKDKQIKAFIAELEENTNFSGGHICLNLDTTTGRKPDQISELVQMINNMVEKNKGGYYSNEMFEKAQEVREEFMQKIKLQPEQQAAVTDSSEPEQLAIIVNFILAAVMGKEQSMIVQKLVETVSNRVEKCCIK
ncbi:hypothetical protein Q5P01_016803 [Channa striata]|uniref:AIG1-type G domain-containing protein n=1 Tax=Channa striata TaxID=64152 RepID=A0AA88M871_CHASR|nr:hypothetical protein Q5P01_016803 [Channa striata]